MFIFNLKAVRHNDSSDITGGSLSNIEELLEPKKNLLWDARRACHPAQAPVNKDSNIATFRLTT